MAARLVAEEGTLKGMVLSLEGAEEWVVGRDPTLSQIILEDPSVSRKHLKLLSSPEGIVAENLSESTPVLVNDEEIESSSILNNGDSIKIGDGYYRFYEEETSEITDLPFTEESVGEQEEQRDTIFEDEEEAEDVEKEGLLAEIDLDLSESAPWLLKVVSGPNNGAQFSMFPDTSYVIGSDPSSCDIVFHDVSVSRQHARIYLNQDNAMSIEDLGSSNGTLIESKKTEGRQTFSPNTLISVGTTSFIVYDREGERSTIISPLLPQIVKILQQQEGEAASETPPPLEGEAPKEEEVKEEAVQKAPQNLGSFLFVSILTGVFIIVGIATLFLFQAEDITDPEYNPKQALETTIGAYPSIRWNYNATTGRLLLVGHVLTPVDRNQLIYNVRSLPFIKEVDDNIIVDELIWKEQNQIIEKNPNWRGVTIYSPAPGKFVISGYIKTRSQSDALTAYLGNNFPYLDLLEQNIIVEENIINRVKVMLQDKGFRAVDSTISSNGEVVLSGDIPFGEKQTFQGLVEEMQKINGVRDVRTYITELPPADTMVDLTGQYTVSGSATQPNGQITVIVNGKFLSAGDTLDGRKITKIDSNAIMLESGGIKYRIDYNR